MPDLVTYPKQTPINEWCVVKCGPKKGHQKDMRFKEVGLLAQILLTILICFHLPTSSYVWGPFKLELKLRAQTCNFWEFKAWS
jgi:hypothetical protein